MATRTGGNVAVQVGWAVFSADGEDLGSVVETMDDYFKVKVPLGFDFFVRYGLIERAQDKVVHLRATKTHLLEAHLVTSVPPESLLKAKDDFGDWVPEHLGQHHHGGGPAAAEQPTGA